MLMFVALTTISAPTSAGVVGAVNVTVGIDVYPLPPLVNVIPVTAPDASIVAVPLACVPPAGGGEIVNVGATV